MTIVTYSSPIGCNRFNSILLTGVPTMAGTDLSL